MSLTSMCGTLALAGEITPTVIHASVSSHAGVNKSCEIRPHNSRDPAVPESVDVGRPLVGGKQSTPLSIRHTRVSGVVGAFLAPRPRGTMAR